MRPGRSARLLPALGFLLLVLVGGSWLPPLGSSASAAGPAGSLGGPRDVPLAPSPPPTPVAAPTAPPVAPEVRQVDHTAVGPLGTLPTSDLLETPPPEIPATTPTTFVVASDEKCGPSGGCTPSLNITAPAGPWALILLNFTGQVVAGVYDSSYHAMVNSVPVLFGTTPENDTWTVLKNLTEYSSLFDASADFQFVLGEAVTTGYFLLSVSVAFYPEPAGAPAPVVPSEIVPLWPFTGDLPSRPVAHTNATVPNDVVNATLEMYAYGFGPNGGDEFWYTLSSPYRAINVTVGDVPLADILPFEYVNTGGISLFLWDPITGAYTADDPPYEVDVTSALGLLEGHHEFNASINGEGGQSQDSWFVAGSLLLYTSSTYGAASLISDSTPSQTVVHTRSYGVPVDYVNQTLNYSSSISTNGAFETVSSSTTVSFRALFAGGGNAVSGVSTTTEEIQSPAGDEWINSSSSPSMQFTSTGAVGAGFSCGAGATCYNETSTISSLFQNWNTTRVDTYAPTDGPPVETVSYTNDNVTANDNWSGELEENGGGTELVAIYYKFANTTKSYDSLIATGDRTLYFDQTLSSQLVPSDVDAAAVVEDLIRYDDLVSISQSNATTESGVPDTFTAHPLGYGAPFTYQWSGLSPGCTAASVYASTVTCRASAVQNYTVSVAVESYLGQPSEPVSVTWVNLARLVPHLSIEPVAIDLDQPAYLNLSYSGGDAPITCMWTADAQAIGGPGACDQRIVYRASAIGSYLVNVSLTDALGVKAAINATFVVVKGPTVYVTLSPPSTTAIPVLPLGSTLLLSANVNGGIAPFTFAWFQNGDPIPDGGDAQNYSFEAITNGNYSFTVDATDADGLTVASTAIEIEVPAGTTQHHAPPTGGNSTPGISSGTEALIGVGVVAVVVIAALVVITRRRPPSDAPRGEGAEPPIGPPA